MDLSTSLAIVIILGMCANFLFIKLKLPGLLGMLLLGILIGPYGLDWLSEEMLLVSGDFRKIALVVILLRAGLGISKEALHKVGKTAVKLSFIPCVVEGTAIALIATYLLEFSWVEGGVLGFVIAAVSPAVIVPSMLNFIDQGIGRTKSIPTLILASASIDDIFAITLFSSFLGLYTGNNVSIGRHVLLGIPLSILLGILVGIVSGSFFVYLFSRYHIRDTKKVLYILGVSILLTALENLLKSHFEVAGLLGVMTVGFILLEKKPEVAKRLAVKFNKIWVFAEILLFVLVGAEVNIHVALEAGLLGIVIIVIGLLARCFGVFISTLRTGYNLKEKFFLVISFMPKATVQAAIGALPKTVGLASGDLILAIAVLSILITAPLGALGIQLTGKKWLGH
jgi:NhaP-type Na+/H+ or K+/H+ antiporter